ncbi:MAG: DUF3047 domain-containing protein [Gammaproteobacteria bacterium]
MDTPHAAAPSLDAQACALAEGPQARRWIAGSARLALPAHRPPWQPTGLRVRAAQAYSVFAAGRVQWAASMPELYGGPRFHLWLRVAPGGRIRNLREDSDTFVADVDGELEIGLYMGLWRDAHGTLATDPALYARLGGGLEALVVVWQDDPAAGLAALAARAGPDSPYAIEAQHLRTQPPLPAGWDALIETGETHLFVPTQRSDGSNAIRLHGDDDQGILCRACDFPLTPATRLSWAWRLDRLPSARPEDSARCHDYVSIATEFDDGRDLTWLWSSSLEPGHHFACPVKAWAARETHFVVRSGAAGLGRWQRDERAVWADVAAALAGPPPRRIVRVWLIAVASFQHGALRGEFAEIELVDGTHRQRIL